MVKKLTILAALAVMLMPLAAGAQTPQPQPPPDPAAQAQPNAVVRQLRPRLQRRIAAGRITPAERIWLRGQLQALRDRFRALRQSGQRLTAEQRQEFRQAIRQLRRDFAAARRR